MTYEATVKIELEMPDEEVDEKLSCDAIDNHVVWLIKDDLDEDYTSVEVVDSSLTYDEEE